MEGADDPADRAAGPGDSAPAPPDAPDRAWRHPSEIGLDARRESDRRRGFGLLAGLVVVGGVVLLGVAAISQIGSQTSEQVTVESDTAAPAIAATVTVAGPTVSRSAIAVLMDDGRHALAPAAPLGRPDDKSISVHAGGMTAQAAVVATDPESEMVLLELEQPIQNGQALGSGPAGGDPSPTSGEPVSTAPSPGEEYLFTHLDHMGDLRTEAVTVESTDARAEMADGTTAHGLLALHGWTEHEGPLTDSHGHLAGWVFPAKGDQMVAWSVDSVTLTAARLAASE